MDSNVLDIGKGIYQPIWLTIDIPVNSDAGNYTATLRVSSGSAEQSIPVNLTVYDLTLPAERHLKVTEWYSTRNFHPTGCKL